MARISFENASFIFPNFEHHGRSLKKRVFNSFGFGGQREAADTAQRAREASGLFEISLDIKPGDRLGIVGGNGAGKSTLLRAMSGVFRPVSGSIKVDGTVGSLLNIGMGTDAFATGYENIFIRGIGLGMSLRDIESMIDEIIEFSELSDFIYDPVKTYSTGMYMRLMFSIVTAFKKDIVLMDEWLSVGDHYFNKKAEKKLADFLNLSEILVIASHSREQIESLCNKAIFLEGGRLVQYGSPKEICEAYWGSVT